VDKGSWTYGHWCAYVEKGETHDERKRRLEEVPEDLRKAVRRHAQTVYAINSFHKRKRLEREKSKR